MPSRPSRTSKKLPGSTPSGQPERLQKIMAQSGIASRRASETLILEGHVQVNGKTVTTLGAKAILGKDKITVNFQPLQKKNTYIYFLISLKATSPHLKTLRESRPSQPSFLESRRVCIPWGV